MDQNGVSTKPNEQQQQQPPMPINDETTRYLWNLAQKSNLTVTTAKTQFFAKQENADDTLEKTVKTINLKEAVKMKWKDPKEKKGPACNTNPFAALPLSLIKNGILSVTSDSACVKIENGVPILKETTAPLMPPCSEQKNAITIEPVLMKTRPSATLTKIVMRPTADELKSGEPKVATSELCLNVAQFQRKMLLQQQILKAIFKPNGVRPLPPNTLIPNTNQMEFAALLGLELVTEFCLSEYKPNQKPSMPHICAQCGTDFSPRWHSDGSSSLQKFCERCYFWHMRLKNTEDRIKQFQTQAVNLQRGLKLPPPKIKSQTPLEPHQLFKNYLNTLVASGVSGHDSCIGYSDLTKLGASIAGNPEVYKAMENLRSLNSTASPEVRAKAIQNLQLAFYKGLNEVLKISDLKAQQQETLLQHCQLAVAQLAHKAGLTFGQSMQTVQRRTGAPLEVFERAIKEHKQRLLKTIKNAKN